MKILSSESYQHIRTWMYRNARPLELALWQYSFENGSKDNVISILTFYQNEDGGFGHSLEADNWNPDSTPYTTLYAINILRLIGFNELSHPIYQGILRFLESGVHLAEYGWLFSIPSNNEYPHAPWWTYNIEANKTESIGITAELAAFILKNCDHNSELYNKALSIAKYICEKLKIQSNFGDLGINGYCVLLDVIKTEEYKAEIDYDYLHATVKDLVYKSIERDVSRWAVYGVRPSNYITAPESMFYKENEDIVETELDYLIDTIPENNVWGITWTWFDNTPQYAKEFTISENWWKAYKAIEKGSFLRNFGRIACPA
ncbi:hypothetical protein DFR58_101304 [Anaerobacterium chartisolvens]|uniref:Prenyltransferase/squalene oxidase-like repeat protein n=1 Tax=Anaerobacterium chartisolvens TaxID=1297424 RepID=A0A369BN44_9FIRM|nr:hypothetical protein [Anaerobacterium chartisolvens]RCX21094.1 hypothetical protein DFR58_101304 [Anaerobacterium chartisolvens]